MEFLRYPSIAGDDANGFREGLNAPCGASLAASWKIAVLGRLYKPLATV
jgi:hypothetical protein